MDAWANALNSLSSLTPTQQVAAFSALSGEQVANVTTAAINASDRFTGMLRAGLFGQKRIFQQPRVGASTQGAAMSLSRSSGERSGERSGVDGPSGGADTLLAPVSTTVPSPCTPAPASQLQAGPHHKPAVEA